MATKSVSEEKQREIRQVAAERVKLEREALDLVICLVESPRVDGLELKKVSRGLTPNHYEDVVEERSIARMCGYPLCSNALVNVPHQKYHISLERKQMYDLTDAKRFCSAFCYKASKYYKSQLSATPLWLRKEERHKEIKLLDRNSSSGPDTANRSENMAGGTNADRTVLGQDGKGLQQTQDTAPSPPENEFNSLRIEDTSLTGVGRSSLSLPSETCNEPTSCSDDRLCTSTFQDAARGLHESGNSVVHSKAPNSRKPAQCGNNGQSKEVLIKEASVPNSVQSGETICKERQGNLDQVNPGSSNNSSLKASSKPVSSNSSVRKHANARATPASKKPLTVSEMTAKVYRTLSQWCTPHTQWILSEQGWKDREKGPLHCSEARLIDPAIVSKEEKVGNKEEDHQSKEKDGSKEQDGSKVKGQPREEGQTKDPAESGDSEGKPDNSGAPVLPTVDHSSQLAIRRKIVLQKILPLIRTLTSLQVHLYSSDVGALVRTFRLQADNVMLSPMEWCIAAIVFVHCLSSKNESIARQMNQPGFASHLGRLQLTADVLKPLIGIFIIQQ